MTDLIERLRSQAHLTQRDGLLALLETGKEAADRIGRDADNTRALLSRIAQLEANLAATRAELDAVPGRIADWLDEHAFDTNELGGTIPRDFAQAIRNGDWKQR